MPLPIASLESRLRHPVSINTVAALAMIAVALTVLGHASAAPLKSQPVDGGFTARADAIQLMLINEKTSIMKKKFEATVIPLLVSVL